MEEEWKIHPVSKYLISESGRIINPKTDYELKPTLGAKGYLRVGHYICRSGMVHTAVIEAFSGEIVPIGMQVNHKDGNKLNNHYSNLEVCTPSENTLHAYRTGLARARKGEEVNGSKVTEKQLAIIDATRDKEKAELERQTMEIALKTARLEAEKIKELADANAHAKEAVLKADGALQQKLATLEEINKVWAEAASRAPVSQISMGGEGGSSNRQSDISNMMSLLTAKAAKDLAIDLKVK